MEDKPEKEGDTEYVSFKKAAIFPTFISTHTQIYICTHKYTITQKSYFKKLSQVNMEVGKSDMLRAGQQTRNSGNIFILESWSRILSSTGNLRFCSQGLQFIR